jgi:hypothetical protein
VVQRRHQPEGNVSDVCRFQFSKPQQALSAFIRRSPCSEETHKPKFRSWIDSLDFSITKVDDVIAMNETERDSYAQHRMDTGTLLQHLWILQRHFASLEALLFHVK